MGLTSGRPSRANDARERILAEVTGEKTKTKRLNVEIDAETYKRFKIKAAGEDKTLADIMRNLVDEYLSKD